MVRRSFFSGSLAAGLILLAAPADAYDVFLDYNTDGILQTFNNEAVGPVSVPVDIVVEIQPGDLGLSFFQAGIGWGYGGSTGDPGCFDVFGSVDYIRDQPLPDAPPFVNIVPFTCVCFGRCWCESQLFISADVSGLTSPGLYRIATLTFSRVGFANDCSSPTYAISTFTTYSSDPRGTLVIRSDAVAVGQGVETTNWGRIKALYRN
jgi:hypothetical protein